MKQIMSCRVDIRGEDTPDGQVRLSVHIYDATSVLSPSAERGLAARIAAAIQDVIRDVTGATVTERKLIDYSGASDANC